MSPAMPGRFFTTSATWEAPCRSILTDKDVCNILTKKKKRVLRVYVCCVPLTAEIQLGEQLGAVACEEQQQGEVGVAVVGSDKGVNWLGSLWGTLLKMSRDTERGGTSERSPGAW